MTQSYQIIVFDLDGTLIDSKKDIATSTNYALEQLGLKPLPSETIQNFVGSGASQLIEKSLQQVLGHQVAPALLTKAMTFFRTHYQDNCLQETTWYPHVVQTLTKLKPRYKMGVLTNKPRLFTEIILEGLSANCFFDAVICGESDFPKKPHPAGLFHILSKVQATPTYALLVGDSQIDAQTAYRTGVDLALVNYGFGKPFELDPLACQYRIDSFVELSVILGC